MADQTVTTIINYDNGSLSGLLNGENIAINGGSVTIDADVRYNQQGTVFNNVTLSATLGGEFIIDGTKIWEVPFSSSTGNVPTQSTLGNNGVTGGTSGATGELTRVWATGSLNPAAAGGAMPATGFIKLRSKTGNFQNGETITLPGGATVTASGSGKRSWINVVGRETGVLTTRRLANFEVVGDWYEIGQTDGTDNQQLFIPVQEELTAVQVETASGSNTYEWWINAGHKWINNAAAETQTVSGSTATLNSIAGPIGGTQYSNGTLLRETATTAAHGTGSALAANNVSAGVLTFRTFVKKFTRQWILVQGRSGSNRYGALIDLNAGTIIANPTVGSPTNTSSTITALTDGWYQVDITLSHLLASIPSIEIYMSDSATPTYNANGFPSYLGATTEGVYYSEALIIHNNQHLATDNRGKYFYSNGSGTLTFAKRDANYNAGLKPPSGCRIRIPNVILSNANAGVYSRNVMSATLATRYEVSSANSGVLYIKGATTNWYVTAATAPASITFENSSFASSIGAMTNVGSLTTIKNCAIGHTRSTAPGTLISFVNCFSGAEITDSVFARVIQATSGLIISMNICKDFLFERCSFQSHGSNNGTPINRPTCKTLSAINCDSITFTDCTMIGGGLLYDTVNNTFVTNARYADVIVGETLAVAEHFAYLTTCDTFIVNGLYAFDNLTNVHPYGTIITTLTACNNIEFNNVGTIALPFCGSVNAIGNIANFSATTTNITMRRVYAANTRSTPIANVNTVQNVILNNVWGGAAISQSWLAVNVFAKGCRWTNPGTVQNTVYGVHWEDAFVSDTDGRLMISANEPTSTTTDQITTTFGLGAGFTAAGGIILPNLSDTVTWTMPYYALGHTSIANFTSAVFTNPWFVTGVNVQYLEFEYQIDTGSGFGSWKFLFNQTRRSSGGTLGTNTVVMNAERASLLRQPQIGDYVQTGSNRLPHNTTITNVSGDTLTLSNNFASAMAANEPILFWKDIRNETISPSTGYKLKVRVLVNTAAGLNEFRFLRIPFDTTSVAQQNLYPLPITQNIGSVTNIQTGSRIRVFNVTTNTEIANEIVSGTSWTYLYDEGTDFTDGDLINVRIAKCSGATAYLDFEATALASANGWSLFADQKNDEVYNSNGVDGTTITEFVFDYPNVQIDINDPDGQTTVTRLYAWFVNELTTEEGIRILTGGLIAEDEANYKIITDILNLKLDNLSVNGVQFTGDLRLYRDDGEAPVVNSTTGGGSITLYAGKVYVSNLSAVKKNTDLIPGLL